MSPKFPANLGPMAHAVDDQKTPYLGFNYFFVHMWRFMITFYIFYIDIICIIYIIYITYILPIKIILIYPDLPYKNIYHTYIV